MQPWSGLHWLKPSQPADEQAEVRGSCVVIETHPLGSVLPLLSPRHVTALGQAQSHFSNLLSSTAHHQECSSSARAAFGELSWQSPWQCVNCTSPRSRAHYSCTHQLLSHAQTTPPKSTFSSQSALKSSLHNLSSSGFCFTEVITQGQYGCYTLSLGEV